VSRVFHIVFFESPRRRYAPLLGIALLMLPLSLQGQRRHTRPAPDPWQHAVDLREKLEAQPPASRTKEQYEAVLDPFREIYHEKPQASKAPAAVAAVADLLAEKGNLCSDQKALKAAIGQYEFLREQYPRSPQVENALLLEGDICRQGLKDTACATEKFRAVVEASPGTSYAEQASLELKEMDAESKAVSQQSRKSTSRKRSGAGNKGSAGNAAGEQPGLRANAKPTPTPLPEQADSRPAQNTIHSPAVVQQGVQQGESDATPALAATIPMSSVTVTTRRPGRVVMITGMRHWSNPTSTRIAIDLSGEVQYEAARVPNPDRIFFDLHGARLAPGLNGRQVEVVDDGFLKRIRAAQFQSDVTRVVLDVTDVSQYSAFLLPNPWRLIIDIHSDPSGGRNGAKTAANPANSSTTTTIGPMPPSWNSANSANFPSPADTRGRATGNPAAAGSGDSTIADVAKLSSEPAKVPATAGPTSGPVSAKVPGASDGSDVAPGENAVANPELSASPSAKRSKKSKSKSSSGTGAMTPGDSGVIAHDVGHDAGHGADPTADGQRSLMRALGLKVGRIVIDAGHGGHDSGTLGPGGIQEKDVVLDVALRVGKLLHQRLGAEIVYTRDDDTFIPLETRTAIANKAQADLFLSIHANSSEEPSARGVEAYYLNFTSDPTALELAARENALSRNSVHQLSDLVRKITLKDKIDESREFAADVDAGLYEGLKKGNSGLRDRGVKKAPFVVLIGAQMPSVLAEISFLTNPEDAAQLREGSYRQRIADALDAGVERYLRGLSGTSPRNNPSKGNSRSAAANSRNAAANSRNAESASHGESGLGN
jgi:N-acetylmuramoyl-L-alanine amidase